MFIKSIWCMVPLKSEVSLFFFRMVLIYTSRILKLPTIILPGPICPKGS
jgi:hypothetical protein